MSKAGGFSWAERRFLAGIALLLGLRQFALLLALPFIALYGAALDGGTPALIGLSLGIYGLMQGLLQIPFARWSDRLGRKSLVVCGTLMLVAGLALAAAAEDMATFIAARALQGAGAVSGVAYAWIGEATAPEARNRAMGVVGAVTAVAAVLSFIGGPLLYRVLTLPQIFMVCAGLAGLVLLYVLVGMPAGAARPAAARTPAPLRPLLADGQVRRFAVAGFLLNFVLMSFVFVMPVLADQVLGAREMWKILIPATLAGVLAVRIAAPLADGGWYKRTAALAFGLFLPAAFWLLIGHAVALAVGSAFFMAGYFILTALLPAGVTRSVDETAQGTASGILQSAQFLGAFLGGVLSGVLWQVHPGAVLGLLIAAAGGGLFVMLRLSTEQGSRARAGAMVDQT